MHLYTHSAIHPLGHPPTHHPLSPSAALLVAAFQAYPAARQAYLDDFFSHVIAYFVAGKKAPRDFVASEDGGGASIQMLTGAVLQMVQVGLGAHPRPLADSHLT